MEKEFTTTQTIDIMHKVGCDIDTTSIEQFKKGLDCESDHFKGDYSIEKFVTDKDDVLGRIVAQHLSEDNNYYTHLELMEQIAEDEKEDEGEDEEEEGTEEED